MIRRDSQYRFYGLPGQLCKLFANSSKMSKIIVVLGFDVFDMQVDEIEVDLLEIVPIESGRRHSVGLN